jgi:predicted DNA-binding transcriptional regulator YafY
VSSLEQALRESGCEALAEGLAGRISIDPETVRRDLARLVLTVVEFLRRLMELQAIRRLDSGSLTAEEEERLGLTLMLSADAVRDLCAQFGVDGRDLNLDLGALGKLM